MANKPLLWTIAGIIALVTLLASIGESGQQPADELVTPSSSTEAVEEVDGAPMGRNGAPVSTNHGVADNAATLSADRREADRAAQAALDAADDAEQAALEAAKAAQEAASTAGGPEE